MTTPERTASSVYDEHCRLRDTLANAGQILAARQASGDEIAVLFRELAAHLLDHFQHEESGGYFAEAIDIAPRLSSRAEELLTQHPQMTQQLAALRHCAAKMEMNEPWWLELDDGFAQFVECLQRHEAAENELLQEAHTEDIGAED